ncbi:hypothetical protein ACM66B_004245 [Microbotryomycetes sp. NB124-2]
MAASASSCEPRADLVIVFDPSVKATIQSERSGQAQDGVSVEQEYSNLIGALNDAGLHATGRPGTHGTNQVLVFVKSSNERLQTEAYRERMADWLHGVTSDKPAPKSPHDFATDELTPAERIRLVYSILTTARSNGAGSITQSTASGTVAGLQPLPSPPTFPHVTAVFPPHDVQYNKQWIKNWSSTQLKIPREQLTEIKDHFGEKVALYFAFLRYYFRSLIVPATLGVIWYLAGLAFSPFYSVPVVVWSIWFVESWRIQERELAVEWGTYGVERVETERAQFKGIKRVVDPVTGVEHQHFPLSTRLVRQLSSVPALLGFAVLLAVLISIIYSIETIVGEVYDGPGKRYLTLVPTVLFVGVVPRVTGLWQATASRLTEWENHAHETEHEKSLTLKVFALNFLVAYGSLLLTSFVYIPFGQVLVPAILSMLPSHHAAKVSRKSLTGNLDYNINSAKLHTQIVAYTLTNQVTGAFIEIGVPYLTSLVSQKVAQVKDKNHGEKVQADEEDEKAFLERIRHEVSLPEYSTFADYAEMTTQFGYLVLFSLIWPIAPLWSFINNFFELRSDAFKITSQVRRPVPVRETSIGPWLEALSFLSWLAALTNAALIYLYRPLVSIPTPIANKLSRMTHMNVTVPQNMTLALESRMTKIDLASRGINLSDLTTTTSDNVDVVSAVKHTLFSALLVALASEHAYLVVRGAVRWLLHQFKWLDGQAERRVRRSSLEMKRTYLDEFGLKKGPIELVKLVNRDRRNKTSGGGGEDDRDGEKEARDGRTSNFKSLDLDQHETEFWSRPDRGLDVVKNLKLKSE